MKQKLWDCSTAHSWGIQVHNANWESDVWDPEPRLDGQNRKCKVTLKALENQTEPQRLRRTQEKTVTLSLSLWGDTLICVKCWGLGSLLWYKLNTSYWPSCMKLGESLFKLTLQPASECPAEYAMVLISKLEGASEIGHQSQMCLERQSASEVTYEHEVGQDS